MHTSHCATLREKELSVPSGVKRKPKFRGNIRHVHMQKIVVHTFDFCAVLLVFSRAHFPFRFGASHRKRELSTVSDC
jgi:hypothetical protein